MIPVVIWGAGGRMGGRCILAILKDNRFQLAGAVDRPDHASIGSDAGLIHHLEATGVELISPDRLNPSSDRGVVLDFSLSGGPASAARWAAGRHWALVTGTTATGASDKESIQTASQTVGIVQASNFSIGIYLMHGFIRKASRTLAPETWDAGIVELHHRAKKDRPSGTALALLQSVDSRFKAGRDIDTVSIRTGSIAGEHMIRFASESEEITFTHRALNRDLFVQGALTAALWVYRQPPGLYGMNDVMEAK